MDGKIERWAKDRGTDRMDGQIERHANRMLGRSMNVDEHVVFIP